MDWGFAETMAYASLIEDGYDCRLVGQDAGRGTFFHRHAVLHNQKTGKTYRPLQHLSDDQARFKIYDSLLSEEAVLAFEYGYSTTLPQGLPSGSVSSQSRKSLMSCSSSSSSSWSL